MPLQKEDKWNMKAKVTAGGLHGSQSSNAVGPYCVGHWAVAAEAGYRHFRIRMMGKNTKGIWSANNQLKCAGIELYGELVDSRAGGASSQ